MVLLLHEKCGGQRQKMIDISAYFLDTLNCDGHCLSYVEFKIFKFRKSEHESASVSGSAVLCTLV